MTVSPTVTSIIDVAVSPTVTSIIDVAVSATVTSKFEKFTYFATTSGSLEEKYSTIASEDPEKSSKKSSINVYVNY